MGSVSGGGRILLLLSRLFLLVVLGSFIFMAQVIEVSRGQHSLPVREPQDIRKNRPARS